MRRVLLGLVVGGLVFGVTGFVFGGAWRDAALPASGDIARALLLETVSSDEEVDDPGLLAADMGRIAESWFYRWPGVELDLGDWHLRVTYLEFMDEGETLVRGDSGSPGSIGDIPIGVVASPQSLAARVRAWVGDL